MVFLGPSWVLTTMSYYICPPRKSRGTTFLKNAFYLTNSRYRRSATAGAQLFPGSGRRRRRASKRLKLGFKRWVYTATIRREGGLRPVFFLFVLFCFPIPSVVIYFPRTFSGCFLFRSSDPGVA